MATFHTNNTQYKNGKGINMSHICKDDLALKYHSCVVNVWFAGICN